MDCRTKGINNSDSYHRTFYRMEEDEHKGNCDSAGLSSFFLGRQHSDGASGIAHALGVVVVPRFVDELLHKRTLTGTQLKNQPAFGDQKSGGFVQEFFHDVYAQHTAIKGQSWLFMGYFGIHA